MLFFNLETILILHSNYISSLLFNVALTGNSAGSMLIPYFGPQLPNPEVGQLNKTNSFFDAGVKITYDMKITDAIKMQLNGCIKNIFNSYQSNFDIGVDRDPAYVYGPLSSRTIYFGLNIGNL